MRHFGMTRDELIAMFSKLHVARLDHTMPVTMYSVPAGGAIKMHPTSLRKGELVFEDASGSVVLKLKCGNPVVGGKLESSIDMPPEAVASVPPLRPLTAEVTGPESTGPMAQIMTPETTPDVMPPMTPTPPANDVVNNVTNNYVTNNTTTVSRGGTNGLAGLLFAVPILAFAGASIHHDCGCSCPTPTPTPEPMSMVMLGGGAAGLLLRRRARK
jgi:hypothetical protein